jgi:hypothetical protein
MNIELRQMWQLAVALIGLGVFSFLYSLGGRGDTLSVSKAIRRYVGSAIFSLACLIVAKWSGAFSWWMILAWPALSAALTMGYGGSGTLASRLRERMLYGLAVGLSSAPLLLPIGLWEVLLVQTILSIAISAWAGIRNKTSAVGEEGYLAVVYALPIFFLIR